MKKFITNLIWFFSPCRKCKDKDINEEILIGSMKYGVATMMSCFTSNSDKRLEPILKKLKDLIKRLVHILVLSNTPYERYEEEQKEAEQFLNGEAEKCIYGMKELKDK